MGVRLSDGPDIKLVHHDKSHLNKMRQLRHFYVFHSYACGRQTRIRFASFLLINIMLMVTNKFELYERYQMPFSSSLAAKRLTKFSTSNKNDNYRRFLKC